MAISDCKILSFKIPYDGKTYIGIVNDATGHISIELPIGASLKELYPQILVSSGATVSPASGSKVSLENNFPYTVRTEDGESSRVYRVYAKVKEDKSFLKSESTLVVGWSNVRFITGNLSKYVRGGMEIKLNNFLPKQIIGIQVDRGYSAFFDVKNRKLRVFSAPNVEVEPSDDVFFTLCLMGE